MLLLESIFSNSLKESLKAPIVLLLTARNAVSLFVLSGRVEIAKALLTVIIESNYNFI
jgi:hypothetical protein